MTITLDREDQTAGYNFIYKNGRELNMVAKKRGRPLGSRHWDDGDPDALISQMRRGVYKCGHEDFPDLAILIDIHGGDHANIIFVFEGNFRGKPIEDVEAAVWSMDAYHLNSVERKDDLVNDECILIISVLFEGRTVDDIMQQVERYLAELVSRLTGSQATP